MINTKGIFLYLYFQDGHSVKMPLQAPIHSAAGDGIRIGTKKWMQETLALHGASRIELRRFGRILAAHGTVESKPGLAAVQAPVKATPKKASWKPAPITSLEVYREHG